MRPTPVFGDPKTDFVFQRIFGSDDHKTALIGFLNDILQLDQAHRITSVMLLSPEQRPKVAELKHSIVDVKCVDVRGTTYVVEMQVFNVEAFEKRVVYNVAKAYTNQLGVGFAYPELDEVIGISICDFELMARGISVSTEARAHIETCKDVPTLDRWIVRAATASSAEEVIDSPSERA
jgi:predicted transposase/invertase (TIGR01784 family)